VDLPGYYIEAEEFPKPSSDTFLPHLPTVYIVLLHSTSRYRRTGQRNLASSEVCSIIAKKIEKPVASFTLLQKRIEINH
jgi:hypothetical protein